MLRARANQICIRLGRFSDQGNLPYIVSRENSDKTTKDSEDLFKKREAVRQKMIHQMKVQTTKIPKGKEENFDKLLEEKFPELKRLEDERRQKKEYHEQVNSWYSQFKWVLTKSHSGRLLYISLAVMIMLSLAVGRKKRALELQENYRVKKEAYELQIRDLESYLASKE